MSMWRMDIRIQPYVIRSGFYGIYRLGHIAIDWPLITSLVERWRPKTHTFHVPVGEMTITLQDVAILLGLRIHGPAVTGTCSSMWRYCARSCSASSHPPMLSEEPPSPCDGYVFSYPPRHLMQMMSH